MADDVYSNAFNFASYYGNAVDLRTGQFNANILLAVLRPQGAAGGSRDIRLRHSPMKRKNDGYGLGWRIGVSEFDIESLVLGLATGESFTAKSLPKAGNPIVFTDQKLKNVEVSRTAKDEITVVHIDGTVETLTQASSGDPFRLATLTFENGERFSFKYAISGLLRTVVNDANDTILKLAYSGGDLKTAQTLVQGGRTAETTFTLSNDDLTGVTVRYDNTDGNAKPGKQPVFVYSYKTLASGFRVIAGVDNPMGGTDTVSYGEGLAYAKDVKLPAVSIWTRVPGSGQPRIVKHYSFSGNNFTGAPFSGGFTAGTDNLYRISGDYDYWCEETTVDPGNNDAVLERIRCTFNKFHLMTQKVTSRGKASITEAYSYNIEAGKAFAKQPANLHVPRKVETTFLDKTAKTSRTVTVETQSDDYGNIVAKTEASGIGYAYAYYPAVGDGTNCPAVPKGSFVRFRKSETVTPASGGGDSRTTTYTYLALSCVQGSDSFVREHGRTVTQGSTTVSTTNGYVDGKTQPKTHGRLSSSQAVIGGKTTSTAFSYAVDGSNVTETRTVTGHDSTTTSTTRTFCALTGLTLGVQSAGDAAIAFTYDVLGRVISEAVAAGTDQEASIDRVYHFVHKKLPARLEENDALGTTYLSRYDGLGRLVSKALVDPAPSAASAAADVVVAVKTKKAKKKAPKEKKDKPAVVEHAISALAYDKLGRTISETRYDTLGDNELTLTTGYAYSDWGDIAETTRPDGSVWLTRRDLVANTVTTGISGLDTTVTAYNDFGKVASVTRFKKPSAAASQPTKDLSAASTTAGDAGVVTRQYQYDGLGRCTSETDADGNVIGYSFDAFDRPTAIAMTPADTAKTASRTVGMRYADFTAAALPVEIKIGTTVLGTRGYDGVGRLAWTAAGANRPTSSSDGSKSSRYSYDGRALQPATSTSPRGITLAYGYHDNLGSLASISRRTTAGAAAAPAAANTNTTTDTGLASLTHDPVSGLLTAASNAAAVRTVGYDDFGMPESDAVTVDGQSTQLGYDYSRGGRCRSITIGDDRTISYTYDARGRPSQISFDGMTEDLGYDGYGRLQSVTLTQGDEVQTTTLDYDDLGRESSRTFALGGKTVAVQRRTLNAADQITERKAENGSGAVVSLETFAYDAYSRLLNYACSGDRRPSDRQGRNIASQEFSYDAFDNITRVKTTFGNGKSNVSTRTPDTDVPTRIAGIADTNPKATRTLGYDADGNLTSVSGGQTYGYDDLDRLTSASDGGSYGYDGEGRQITQTPPGGQNLRLLYGLDRLVGQSQGATTVAFHRDGAAVQGRSVTSDGSTTRDFNALDRAGNALRRTDKDGKAKNLMFTPYGDSDLGADATAATLAGSPCIGFNGERLDGLANLYHLGNGRRAYSPDLMMFLSPDPLAPFGSGGFNAYSYCGGDPVNRVDPTGLFATDVELGIASGELVLATAFFLIALAAAIPTGGASLSLLAVAGAIGAGIGVVGSTLGVASAAISFVDEKQQWDRSATAKGLGEASLALGLVSIVLGVGVSAAIGKAAARASLGAHIANKVRPAGYPAIRRAVPWPGETARIASMREVGIKEALKDFAGIQSHNPLLSPIGVANLVYGGVNTVRSDVEWISQKLSGGTGAATTATAAPPGTASNSGPFQAASGTVADALATHQDFAGSTAEQSARIRTSLMAEER